MIVGHSCLRSAAGLLAGWNGDRARLAQAAEFCWLAGFWFLLDWPERLRERYGELFRPLIGPWTFGKAIGALDEPHAAQLADDLLHFAAEALPLAPDCVPGPRVPE